MTIQETNIEICKELMEFFSNPVNSDIRFFQGITNLNLLDPQFDNSNTITGIRDPYNKSSEQTLITIKTNKQTIDTMTTLTVPTVILESMKSAMALRFYNNEIDATMSNVHIRLRVERLIAKGMKFTTYTDGINQLIVIGEGVNQKHFSGTSVLSA